MGFISFLAFVFLIIGFQFTPQTDASIDTLSGGCKIGDKIHPDGSFTTADRCQGYRCTLGAWEFDKNWPKKCKECSTELKTSITMYEEHKINSKPVSSYEFDGSAGTYRFTQSGLETSSLLGVNVTFEYTTATETSITNVVYKEPGIKVEFVSNGPTHDAKILINGEEKPNLKHNGSMTAFSSKDDAWVYISNDSPSWPRPVYGGNIHIVGTKGIAVSIYALHGYAHFVHTYALPNIKHSYGLCDVITPVGKGITPDSYTLQSGGLTTNKNDFIGSWMV